MLPRSLTKAPRAVRTFDVITPAGQIHHFPHPSVLQRVAKLLRAYSDVIAVSGTIVVLIYVAGLAAEALDRSAFDACIERVTRPT